MKSLLIAALTVLFALSASAGEWTWISTADTDWNVDGSWNPAGYPEQIDDVASFVDLDEATGMTQAEIFRDDYHTCGVVRCTADTNRYQIFINGYVPNALCMQSSAGNAQIIVDDQYDAGSPSLAINGHNLKFLSDTDIIVSNEDAQLNMGLGDMAGSGAINKYGPGRLYKSEIDTGYSGTITIYDGMVYCSNPRAFSNANAIVIKNDSWLLYNYHGTEVPVVTPVVIEDGWLAQDGNIEKWFADVTVNGTANVSSKWYNTVFDGSLMGTGTVYVHKRPFYVLGDVEPGFSMGDLTFRRVDGTLRFGTNGTPATIHIEVGGGTSDRILFENMNSDIDLENISVVFDGAGNQGATNWFLESNRIANGSEFDSISAEPGTIVVEVLYDYDNDRVGAVIMPEPAAFGLLLVGASLLRRM